MGLIVSLLSFFKDQIGIEYPTKVDKPLNKEATPVQGEHGNNGNEGALQITRSGT